MATDSNNVFLFNPIYQNIIISWNPYKIDISLFKKNCLQNPACILYLQYIWVTTSRYFKCSTATHIVATTLPSAGAAVGWEGRGNRGNGKQGPRCLDDLSALYIHTHENCMPLMVMRSAMVQAGGQIRESLVLK